KSEACRGAAHGGIRGHRYGDNPDAGDRTRVTGSIQNPQERQEESQGMVRKGFRSLSACAQPQDISRSARRPLCCHGRWKMEAPEKGPGLFKEGDRDNLSENT